MRCQRLWGLKPWRILSGETDEMPRNDYGERSATLRSGDLDTSRQTITCIGVGLQLYCVGVGVS